MIKSQMGILFNSVTQFVQQPERTKRWVKRDDLDTLNEIWVGPSSLEDQFKPAAGTPHSEFNLMTVTSAETKRLPASVSQITITYQGKIDNSGSGAYTSVPTISQYWAEGEVSYQAVSSVTNPAPGGGFYTAKGIATYSRRYTGRCVQVGYVTNRRPTGNPTNIGLSNDYMGFSNIWDNIARIEFTGAVITGKMPIQQIACTDVKVDDLAIGWYRVTETYQSRMFPGTEMVYGAPENGTVPSTPPPQGGGISARTTLDGTGAGSEGNAQWGTLEGQAIKAQQQADAAMTGGQAIDSPAGSVGAAVRQETGIDPAWFTVAQQSASNVNTGSNSTTGGVSVPLDN